MRRSWAPLHDDMPGSAEPCHRVQGARFRQQYPGDDEGRDPDAPILVASAGSGRPPKV